jgi:hypothetical protein
MSLFTWLRERLAPSDPNPPRTLPKPVRVNLADIQRHDGHFVVVPEWSSLSPAPPRWEIPSAGPQVAWIDDLVAAHARAGTLDGLVPDLLDRAIAFTMDELRAQIDEAHVEGERLIQRLSEQARMAESALARKIHEQRNALVRAEVGYARAYEELTWELPPAADVDALDTVAPHLHRTQPEPFTNPHAA